MDNRRVRRALDEYLFRYGSRAKDYFVSQGADGLLSFSSSDSGVNLRSVMDTRRSDGVVETVLTYKQRVEYPEGLFLFHNGDGFLRRFPADNGVYEVSSSHLLYRHVVLEEYISPMLSKGFLVGCEYVSAVFSSFSGIVAADAVRKDFSGAVEDVQLFTQLSGSLEPFYPAPKCDLRVIKVYDADLLIDKRLSSPVEPFADESLFEKFKLF